MKSKNNTLVFFFLCFFFWSAAKCQLFLEISSVDTLHKDKKIAWKVQGKTSYPKGTLLQISFVKNNPVAMRTILTNSFIVQGKDWEFLLGDFEKELPPGKYSITVFFSPQYQEEKTQFTFQKSKYDFFWKEENYAEAFKLQRLAIKKLYTQIHEFYQIMVRDSESAKKMSMLSIWEAGSIQRKRQLEHLKNQKESYNTKYLVPFFHFPFWDTHALLNLLEDIEDEMISYLHGSEESRIPELQSRFCKRWEQARISFVYESLKLDEGNSSLLQEELAQLYASTQDKRSFSSSEKTPDELRTLSVYLCRTKEIKEKFLQPDMLSQASEFFWEISRQIQEIEDQNLSISSLDLFYELSQSLIREWVKSFYQDSALLSQWQKQDFDTIMKKITQSYSSPKIFIKLLLTDLKDMEDKVFSLHQMCSGEWEGDREETLHIWTAETLRKQQNNHYFFSFTQDRKIQSSFREYNKLCVFLNHLCYLLSVSDPNAKQEIASFLEKIKNFQKILE
ncbi:MAG: hypothetical protein HUU50_14290 [Candidatus Brocadiae bacterium]|nr:hypothetical protein [Candidatus Brocadiia bacterium]